MHTNVHFFKHMDHKNWESKELMGSTWNTRVYIDIYLYICTYIYIYIYNNLPFYILRGGGLPPRGSQLYSDFASLVPRSDMLWRRLAAASLCLSLSLSFSLSLSLSLCLSLSLSLSLFFLSLCLSSPVAPKGHKIDPLKFVI